MEKNKLMKDNKSSNLLLLKGRLAAAPPPTETTLMLESLLDGKKQRKITKPKRKPFQEILQPVKDTEPERIMELGDLCQARTFQQVKAKPLPTVPMKPTKNLTTKSDYKLGKSTSLVKKADKQQISTKPSSSLCLNIHKASKKRPLLNQNHSSFQPMSKRLQVNTEQIHESVPPPKSSTSESLELPENDAAKSRSFSFAPDHPTTERPMMTVPNLHAQSNLPPPEQLVASKPFGPSKRTANPQNFVRLNLKNKGGSCVGAKNKSKWSRRKKQDDHARDAVVGDDKMPKAPRLSTSIDPLDDYLDGNYHSNDQKKDAGTDDGPKNPTCGGHQRACRLLVVKKSGANKGRKFFVCSMPKGEQCDYFEWAEDSIEAAKQALLKKSSYSGFVARQVSSHVDRFRTLTVPELRSEAKRRGLNLQGKKQELLMRLSLHVRDELTEGVKSDETELNDDHDQISNTSNDEDDDSSTSSLELEVCGGADEDRARTVTNECDCDSSLVDDDQQEADGNHGTAETTHDDASSVKSALRNLFGYSNFRPGQEWAIQRCLSQKRSLLVAPTGFGKSLCYALPAALMEGTCIVISPLISLIEDQLRQLPPKITAVTLSGGMSASGMACTIDDILKNRIKILFVSPERLTTPSFRRLFQAKWNKETQSRERPFPQVSLLCIDEAHCMSQWAHNFRPSYMRIRSLIECIQPKSVLAITATAGPPIIDDICRNLDIPRDDRENGVKVLKSDRDNIDVYSQVMDSVEARLVLVQKLLSKSTARCDLGKDSPVCDGCLANGNVIVYVWRQRDAEVVAETLVAAGVEGGVVVYHGGMDSAARTKAQSSFLRGKARVCVATVAFGLGVNKIDIDAVVHMNLPSSLEHYLQEIGRAGRDGRPARAVSLPITDEVILRHSLAHSDLISKSQVLLLLRTIQTQIDLVLSDLDLKSTMIATQEYRVYIPIRIHHAIEALDLKTETIETLLSLMEGDEISKSLFRFEGRTNDSVLIVLKRSTLKELEIREEVIRCIAKCGSACDLSKSEENQVGRASVALRKLASRSTGLGAIEFSVSRCTNLMGPSAEPRHVFAALRRLQSSGEIELMTDASGLAMQLQLKGTAITMFDELKHADSSGLAETIWLHFTNHIANTASKIRRIDSILRQVAAVKDKGILTEQGKSLRLKMFQELATETLAGGREFEGSHIDIEELPPKVSPASFKELKYDAQSVLNLLCTGMTPNDGLERSNSIIFDHSDFMDYTALAVTKFLHGIDSKRTATFSRHHPLFAKWRQHEFTSVAACVEDCLKSQI